MKKFLIGFLVSWTFFQSAHLYYEYVWWNNAVICRPNPNVQCIDNMTGNWVMLGLVGGRFTYAFRKLRWNF